MIALKQQLLCVILIFFFFLVISNVFCCKIGLCDISWLPTHQVILFFYAFKMAVAMAFLCKNAVEAMATAILNTKKNIKLYIRVVVLGLSLGVHQKNF